MDRLWRTSSWFVRPIRRITGAVYRGGCAFSETPPRMSRALQLEQISCPPVVTLPHSAHIPSFFMPLSFLTGGCILLQTLHPCEGLGEGEGGCPPPSRWGDYFSVFSTKRMRMVATWARVALPWGDRVVAEVPEMIPLPTAQAMASVA